jgi:IPT/TIG domain
LRPNIGSTGGGTLVVINGTGVGSAVTVTVGGIVSPFEAEWGPDDPIYLSTPAHAAGTVEVIVTDRYGQAASGVFTYASPATFDFNGDWTGYVENLAAWKFAHLELTIRNNIVVSVSCGERHDGVGASSLTLDRPPAVANGGFSFTGSGGDSITGNIVAPNSAFGSINMPSCVPMGEWRVERK